MQYTLDLAKWRCGGESNLRRGDGETMMLNGLGYMCCLGQFAVQHGVPKSVLDGRGDPADVAEVLMRRKKKVVYDEAFLNRRPGRRKVRTTDLTRDLIQINDREDIDTTTRIKLLTERLARNGHTLVVIDSGEEPA